MNLSGTENAYHMLMTASKIRAIGALLRGPRGRDDRSPYALIYTPANAGRWVAAEYSSKKVISIGDTLGAVADEAESRGYVEHEVLLIRVPEELAAD